jgi:hypothetical protein
MLFQEDAEITYDAAATFSHDALIQLLVLLPVLTGALKSFTDKFGKTCHTGIGDLVGKSWHRWLG